MNTIHFTIPAIFCLIILIIITVFHFRKNYIIQKVRSLTLTEKTNLINRLCEPAGYGYEPCQDIFTARLDAPQKIFGYTTLYDLSAPYFNMVFDYETIYFDYHGRTWLIEMWKGQYGINTGCELGIYYTDEIVPPDKYNSTLFKAVEPNDMLDISLKLNRHCTDKQCPYTKLGRMCQRHWWLTIFKTGMFAKPTQLFVNTSIRFKDHTMMYSFLDSFKEVLPFTTYKIRGLTVYFTFYESRRKYSFFSKIIRHLAITVCFIYCKWFQYVTRPFSNSGDKLLYLYYYLPFVKTPLCKKIGKK